MMTMITTIALSGVGGGGRWPLVAGVRCLVSGVWCLVSGFPLSVSGGRCPVSGGWWPVVLWPVAGGRLEKSGKSL